MRIQILFLFLVKQSNWCNSAVTGLQNFNGSFFSLCTLHCFSSSLHSFWILTWMRNRIQIHLLTLMRIRILLSPCYGSGSTTSLSKLSSFNISVFVRFWTIIVCIWFKFRYPIRWFFSPFFFCIRNFSLGILLRMFGPILLKWHLIAALTTDSTVDLVLYLGLQSCAMWSSLQARSQPRPRHMLLYWQ